MVLPDYTALHLKHTAQGAIKCHLLEGVHAAMVDPEGACGL